YRNVTGVQTCALPIYLAILSSLPSILVIDDNKDILWMIKDIFREEYTVLTAENAEEGMKVLKKYSPVLVITDIMMPGIDGITLTRSEERRVGKECRSRRSQAHERRRAE